jgi:Zn-dependent protease with chaperone function
MQAEDVELLLAGVAPVELPPPDTTQPRSAPLALRALVSVALLVGLFVLGFGVVLALIGVNVLLYVAADRIQFALVAAALAAIAAMGRGLLAMLRKAPDPLDEIVVPASEEPDLHDRLRRLAEQVGTRPPDRVVMTAEVNAYVREFGPLMGLVRGKRTLAIGAPLLDVLTVSQLEAVLAHELGHLAGGDTRLGPLTFKTSQATVRMIQSFRGHPLARVFVAYWKLQNRVSAGVRRGQELVADRAAVRVAGRQAAADALHRIDLAATAEVLYREGYLGPLLKAGCRPLDVRDGLHALLRSPSRAEELSRYVADRQGDADPWASHPPTPERIRRVAALADPADVVVDARPARALWSHADHWTRLAHERWLELVTGGVHYESVEWSSFGDHTAVAIHRTRAAEVDRALARLGLPPGIAGLREALDRGREAALAGELVAEGWRTPAGQEREGLVIGALVSSATVAALDAGALTFRFSWDQPLTLVDSGAEEVRLHDLAVEARQGRWDGLEAVLRSGRRPPRQPRRVRPEVQEPATAVVSSIPAPPRPPFAASDDGGWVVTLPGSFTKHTLEFRPGAVILNGAAITYDSITEASINVMSNQGLNATVKIKVTGKTYTLKSSSVGGGSGSQRIAAAMNHLWIALAISAGPRLRSQVVKTLDGGGSVAFGPATLTKEGIASRRTGGKVVPWRDTRNVTFVGDAINIHRTEGKPILIARKTDNAFVLEDLVPELRARFG